MNNYVQAISVLLDTLDFETLWPEFKRVPFALYNQTHAYFEDSVIKRPNNFFGNTALWYEGRYVAIWMIEDEREIKSVAKLTSLIVHEMFHAYQMQAKESRFPNEIDALDYALTEELLAIKYEENMRCAAFLKNSKTLDIESLRTLKNKRFTLESVYDEAIESIEGLAHYVEGKALESFDKDLFEEFEAHMIEALENPKETLRFRFTAYKTGYVIARYYEESGIIFKKPLKEGMPGLYQSSSVKACSIHVNNKIKELYKTYKIHQHSLLFHVLNKGSVVSKEETELMGFDPLNTFKVDNYIVFKTMIALKGEPMTMIQGEGVATLNSKGNVTEVRIMK